jgi:hypothetical protein
MCNGDSGHLESHMCNGGMIKNKLPHYFYERKFNLRNLHRWGYLNFMGLRGLLGLHIIAICDMYIPVYIWDHIGIPYIYDFQVLRYMVKSYLT